MKTKTFPEIVRRVYGTLGRSSMVRHEPTDTNRQGQSGAHTFVDDIIIIVQSSDNESQAHRNLLDYLYEGRLIK